MRKVKIENLIIGKKYYVECGIWRGNVCFVGPQQIGKRTKYRFTFGDVDNWEMQFNIASCKNALKIYEYERVV